MSIPVYSDWVPLPAPTTSTTTVSYTDPSGEVWVAKSTVNAGAWARARDVLKCMYYRNATFSGNNANLLLGHDTVLFDTYGLYTTSNGAFTAPVNGIWRITQEVSAQAAVGTWISSVLNVSSPAMQFITWVMAGSTATLNVSANLSILVKLGPAGPQYCSTYWQCSGSASGVGAGGGIYPTWMSAEYTGTG